MSKLQKKITSAVVIHYSFFATQTLFMVYIHGRSILKLHNIITYPLLFELSRNIEKGFEFPTGERILRQTTAVVATNFSPLLPTRLLNIHKSKISFEFQGLHKRVEKEKNKGEQGRKKMQIFMFSKNSLTEL